MTFSYISRKTVSVTTLIYLLSHAFSPVDFYFRDRLYGFTAKGIRRPMFVKHEDSLGFISLRPLWLALIHLHAERVYVVEEKDQRKNFYLSLRLAHSGFASRASSPKLDARMTYLPSFTSWCHHFGTTT